MYKTLTINGTEYEFKFGFGFVKAISRVKLKDGEEIGLRYRVAQLYDGNPEALVDVLMKARVKTNAPTMEELQDWLEDENTDIDAVFEQVLDFLSTANCSKKQTLEMLQSAREEKEIQKAETAKRRKEAGLD
jgi:hypothetical protein